MFRRALFIGSILVAAALCPARSASAQSTSINGQIAYQVCGLPSTIPFVDTQCDIFVINADGTGETNLTNSTDSSEENPSWSPDGTRIAFFEGFNGNFNLRVMDGDGSNVSGIITTTSTFPFSSVPSWSPGGTQIAFVRNNPGQPVSIQADIVVIDLTTLAETTITGPVLFGDALLDADEIEPAWSPDGGKIAFAGVRLETFLDPIDGTPQQGAQWQIVTVNPDGSGELIVSVGDPGTDRANFLEEDRGPAWSPDGSMIVFMSQDQIFGCCGPWQIWAVNRDGSGATNLSADPSVNDMGPSWSPDGTQIVFSRADGVGGFGLFTMPAPTSLPLAAPLAALRVKTAAATGTPTPIPNSANGANPDWGRTPGTTPPNTFLVSVSVTAQGKGTGGSVTSAPAGIKCGRDCSSSYAVGTILTLTATPKKNSTFTGWSGSCAGMNPVCVLTIDDVKTAGATFARR